MFMLYNYISKEAIVEKLLLIDGNSIINRAFYGIMGNKMLMTEDRNIYKCSIWIFKHII